MLYTNYWDGFYSELLGIDARECVEISQPAVDLLIQYHENLRAQEYLEAYLDWSKLALHMSTALDSCFNDVSKAQYNSIWWYAFVSDEFYRDSIIHAQLTP